MNGRSRVLRQPQMPIEIILLEIEGRVIPVAVEARFADGDDFRLAGQLDDAIPIVRLRPGAIVGLNADGGVDRRDFQRRV